MKKLTVAFAISFILSVLMTSFSEFSYECEEIRDTVLRIHVLANSDSIEDQALKLRVRDEILASSAEIFNNMEFDAMNKEGAIAQIKIELDDIVSDAQKYVYDEGYDYHVSAEVVNMFFDTTKYGDFVMPAGHYDALRVYIGEAQGANWWCVIYPALCIPAAQTETELDENFTKNQLEVIENYDEYEIEFAFLEIFEKVKDLFE